ncbi:MAG: CPBP family intramembrane metalloprotease [Planctomycetota bacterium]|nr:CPBP family intramembrane metalloprotease [Planctomycetota bacterium]
MNQLPSLSGASQVPAPVTAEAAIEPPEALDSVGAMSKFLVKFSHAWVQPGDLSSRQSLVSQVDQSARSPLDRLRAALVVTELTTPEAGRERLSILQNDAKLPSNVREDLVLFDQILAATNPREAAAASHQGLIERHGWFARLALSRGLADTDPLREPLISGGGRILFVLAMLFFVAIVAVFGGLGCFVGAIVLAATGKIKARFEPPTPGGSVFLEVVPIFAGGFLLIKVLVHLLIAGPDGNMPEWALKASLLTQWSLVPLCLWPLVRKTPFAEFRQRIGWHSGKGVFYEMAAGVFGYLACLPLFAAAVVASVLFALVFKGGTPGAAPDVKNPVVDLIGRAGTLELMMFFVLATCWAPLVEEAVFRGSFFRHLRSRLPLLAAAAISAFVFGAMHGYEFFMLGPVMALGFSFALIREWRGSLIGCMTAHFLHNATALSFMLLLLPVLRD